MRQDRFYRVGPVCPPSHMNSEKAFFRGILYRIRATAMRAEAVVMWENLPSQRILVATFYLCTANEQVLLWDTMLVTLTSDTMLVPSDYTILWQQVCM